MRDKPKMVIEIIKERQLDMYGLNVEDSDPVGRILSEIQVKDSSKHHQRELKDFIPKKKQQYPQDYVAYNLAKTNENILFKELLQELLFLAIDEDIVPKQGRKPYTKAQRIFAMCIKLYYRSDLRKCESILKELKKLQYLVKVPSFKSIDNFFNDEQLSIVLDKLILISSLPLANIETVGGIDSTGFSTGLFQNWNSFKWGKMEGKERVWRKAHIAAGTRTHTILGVEVTKQNVGDATMLKKVVGDKPKFFNMKNFVADKAYSSREIVDFLFKLGLHPYIPFRKGTTGKAKGALHWNKLFREFSEKNDEFMRKYHARSNLESCIGMTKMRSGNHLMTRNFQANVNEIKIKVLVHNLTVLVQEAFELDINIDFDECVKNVNLCRK